MYRSRYKSSNLTLTTNAHFRVKSNSTVGQKWFNDSKRTVILYNLYMKMRFRIQKTGRFQVGGRKGTVSIENKSTFSGIAKQICASDRPLIVGHYRHRPFTLMQMTVRFGSLWTCVHVRTNFSNVFLAKFHWTWIKIIKPYQKYFPHFSFFVNSHSLCRLHKYFFEILCFSVMRKNVWFFFEKCRFQVDRFMFIISEINDWRTKRTKTIPNWLKGIHFSFIKPTDEIKNEL